VTPYALLLQLCGLSHREAAEFHGVRPDTVSSWASGRHRAPPGALDELRELHGLIRKMANGAVSTIREAKGARDIEIGYPADDAEARALGMPCVGAWRASMALVVARIAEPIRLVPRGSTLASATAMAAREGARGP